MAKGAGAILKDGFKKKFTSTTKRAFFDLVTEFDLKSEKYLLGRIRKKYPPHGVMAEESGMSGSKKNFWIIDPLDGTHGFAKGIPQFAVSIAFVSNNQLKYGCVYDPIHDEMFFAEKGKGATLNGKKIEVGHLDSLQFATVATYIKTASGLAWMPKVRKDVYNKLIIPHEMWTDKTSSVALGGAYTGAGRLDVYISVALNPWDYAGAGLIMREAGGKVTTLAGSPYRWNSESVVGANPVLHKLVMESLK